MMRRPWYSDVSTAALVLLKAPVADRAALCRLMIREADLADRFTRRLGKAHPWWGTGTLKDTATLRPLADEPSFDDPDYGACFILVLQELGRRPRSVYM